MENRDSYFARAMVNDPRRREFLLRVLATLGFLAFVHLDSAGTSLGPQTNFTLLYCLVGSYLVYAAATFYWHDTLSLHGSWRWLVALIDVSCLCLAIYLSGGVESHTFLFLGLVPLVSGLYGGYGECLFASILVLAGFSVIAVADRQHSAAFDFSRAVAVRYAYIVMASMVDAYIVDLMLEDRKRLQVFYGISQSSSKSPALYTVLKEVTQRMAEVLRAEVALVFLYNEESGMLEAQQPSMGLDFSHTSRMRMDADTPGVLSNSFRDGKSVLVTRRFSEDTNISPLSPGYRVFDLVACPLIARGKSIGLMVLANKLDRKGFNRRDLAFCELISPHISVFIDNALLYRRSEEKVAQLTSLIRVIDAINTVSSLDQLYNLALDVVRGLFAVDKALINIINSQTGLMETVRSSGYSQDYIDHHLSQPFERTGGCYVLRHDETFLCSDAHRDARCPEMDIEEHTRAVLCVPIRAGKKTYGILHMASLYPGAFDEEDAALANAIGEQIGMAVESARLFEEISRLAITDDLTGLYNIRHLKRVLGEEVKRSIRYVRPLSFIMLDIDFFKIYNDQHGHPRGDEVLRIMSGLLQQNTRDVDTVFRYGGEEFSVIIPEVTKQEAYAMAERIRRVVQDYVFPYEEDQPGGNLTVSMGVANLPLDAVDGEELIDMADRALYRAKQLGRNKVCLYEPGEDTRALHPRGLSPPRPDLEPRVSAPEGERADMGGDGERETG